MDEKPFLEIDILNIKEAQVAELKKFHKSNFDIEKIFDIASELKYENEFKNVFANLLQKPSDEFVKLFLTDTYEGKFTQKVVDKFKPILKKSLNAYITELMNDKIKTALGTQDDAISDNIETPSQEQPIEQETASIEKESKIVTTEEELEGYFIVKNLIKDLVNINDITYKDNERYMAILYKAKTTKWICRFYFNTSTKYLAIPDENKKEEKFVIQNVYDIEQYKDKLIASVSRFI